MKLGTAIASIVLVSAAAIAGAQAKKPMNTPAMSKADWQKMYDQAEKMFDKMDARAIFMYMTPDFTMNMEGQKMNKAQSQAGLAQWFGMLKSLHCSMTVTKVSGDAKETVVVDKFNNWGMTKPDPKKHKSGKMVDTGVETAHWVKVNGQWKMKSRSTASEKMTLDGKPFNPNMGG